MPLTVLAASLRSLLMMVIRLAHLGFRSTLLKTEAELGLGTGMPGCGSGSGKGWVPGRVRSGWKSPSLGWEPGALVPESERKTRDQYGTFAIAWWEGMGVAKAGTGRQGGGGGRWP